MAHESGRQQRRGLERRLVGRGTAQQLDQTLDAYNNGLLCAPHRQ